MASKNIVAKGTTYNGVESVTFPVSGGGDATFYEISDTTASASDVLNSKYFYTSSGVKTQGTGTAPSPTLITKSITANGTYNASSDSADGYSSVTVNVSGGGGDSWSWMGKNPTKVGTLANEKIYLKDTGYASWTPSTTASSIIAASTIPNNTLSFDYNAVLLLKFHTHFEYDATATNAAKILDYYYLATADLMSYSSTLTSATTDTRTAATSSPVANRCIEHYLNSSGNESLYVGAGISSGIYVYTFTPFSSISGETFAVGTPSVYTKCNASYFSTTNASAVDQNASYVEYVIDLWRVDKDTTNYGTLAKMIRDIWYDNL